MDRSFRAVAYAGAIFRHGAGWRQGGASAVAAAAQSTSAPSVVSVDGVTLRSVNVDLPDRDRNSDDLGADVVNNNCLACHSAGMVLTQPRLPRAVWRAEVEKMRNAYKAPIAAEDIPTIVDYLASLPR